MKGFIISAAMTGAGKTTVTLGLLAALRNRGVTVQPFKVGPDFIDPGLHEIAAGVPSHNLDGWMLSRQTNEWLFTRASRGREIAIVEGVMGLFDGFDGRSERGSTAEMAVWLNLPVILVIDAQAMARSAAALIHGFRSFDPRVRIAGVIFNRVAGEGHYRILADAVTKTPVLGWLPSDPSIQIPERHLGLFTAGEDVTRRQIAAIGEFFEKHIDFGRMPSPFGRGRAAKRPGEGTYDDISSRKPSPGLRPPSPGGRGRTRVAIACDKAFSFYYHANRIALEEAGAEIIEFSPLADREVPEADLLYLGGGYPELYRTELKSNASMCASIRRYIESGRKFYAECGGLMYLAESIGVIPAQIEMTDRLVDFGYCEVTTRRDSLLGPAGTIARGHQFHYSRSNPRGEDAYNVRQGGREYAEGFVLPNGIASYIHLHFLSNPALARNMLNS